MRSASSWACPICGAAGSLHPVVRLAYGKVHRCASCGSGVLLPRPGRQGLVSLHSSVAYSTHPYFEVRRTTTPALSAIFERRLTTLGHHLGNLRGRKLLDVGCDVGLFVEHARRAAGVESVGIDISDRVVAQGRAVDLDLHCGTLDGADFPPGSFDAVCAYDLVEHVDDPIAWMNEARRVLRPGGILAIETPNFDGLLYRIGRALGRVGASAGLWRGLQERLWPAFHVQYFTGASLDGLMRRCGLAPAEIAGRELGQAETAVSGLLGAAVRAAFGVSGFLGSHTLLTAIARKEST